ncbi:NADH dehydrogenase [ubiquinone] 1 beta subcomplex subunit 7 [Hyposmocoma kahamanoa]|uniref:NADH dehydrogenase [ubiquinone] 1 beta subcomplex subunit 7 n=1 Tax=Hyposmocoma kahamanoa TaxID=1477025 RepID=UPI000E6D71D1|nr:NADH dehydrogenase [ubiquinone] 1 beta subcomplex subunit 7 [Hyposmocoma kahamanoa]
MGQIAGTLTTRDVGLQMNDKATFDPHAGFEGKRKRREMIAKEDDLISARIPPEKRDYCAHFLLDYQVCRYKNMPMIYKCAHEKHNYLNCEQQDYVLRMKEFERERRLRLRDNRIVGAAA